MIESKFGMILIPNKSMGYKTSTNKPLAALYNSSAKPPAMPSRMTKAML